MTPVAQRGAGFGGDSEMIKFVEPKLPVSWFLHRMYEIREKETSEQLTMKKYSLCVCVLKSYSAPQLSSEYMND